MITISNEQEFERAISRMLKLLSLEDPNSKQEQELDELMDAIEKWGDTEPEFSNI